MTVWSNSVTSYLYEIQKLSDVTWTDSVIGLDDTTGAIQDKIDQFSRTMPQQPVSSPTLEVTRVSSANTDFFVPQELPPDYADLSTNIQELYQKYQTPEADIVLDSPVSYQMASIAANLPITTSALGAALPKEKLQEARNILAQTMQRFYSVSLIYGQYREIIGTPTNMKYWYYYDTVPNNLASNGWKQDVGFKGLLQICTGVGENGFTRTSDSYSGAPGVAQNISFSLLDAFLTEFQGSNGGMIDCLVMNSNLYREYLGLWRTVSQPQFIAHPTFGEKILAHNGIPILVDDYILTYDQSGSDFYINSSANPELITGIPGDVTSKQTSLYAVVLGAEKNGLFGIYPAVFGYSPIKIDEVKISPTMDTIYLRGMIQTAIINKSYRSVGKLGGIKIN